MKLSTALSLIIAISASSPAFAQSGNMKDMSATSPAPAQSMNMRNMDMKNMGMLMGDNKNMAKMGQAATPNMQTHTATGVVMASDTSKGTVTIAHGPVASLKWPAMTMTFTVKDKTFFDKLVVGNKASIEFLQQGADYVVAAVK